MNTNSSFDRIVAHLNVQGPDVPVSPELQDDLQAVLRRCTEVRSLDGAEPVELSPYLRSLMRVSLGNLNRAAANQPVAASV